SCSPRRSSRRRRTAPSAALRRSRRRGWRSRPRRPGRKGSGDPWSRIASEDALAEPLTLAGGDRAGGAARVEIEVVRVGEVEQLLLLVGAVGGTEEQPGEQPEGHE